MRKVVLAAAGMMLLTSVGGMAGAQVSLPGLPAVDLGRPLGSVTDLARSGIISGRELAGRLAAARVVRLADFVRRNRAEIEMDEAGNPAVRGELVAIGISAEAIAQAQASGFRLIELQTIEGLDLAYVRFAAPPGMRLVQARMRLARLARQAEISVNPIYLPSGDPAQGRSPHALAGSVPVTGLAVGLIDGGVAAHPSLSGPIEQRGFAAGAPSPSAHGTAVASLIAGRDPVGSAAPGRALLAADVYGTAGTGGNAVAIARALGWQVSRQTPVVTISLVGPDNPLLRAAVRAAQSRGVLIVAAVGNDGPAAPPSYPASWPGVLAVTATDHRGRALPEAGRALHVDFAAPGSRIKAAVPGGSVETVRGTSYAAPLVAGRLALLYPKPDIARIHASVKALVNEAEDLGPKGHDRTFGNGLICGSCVRR